MLAAPYHLGALSFVSVQPEELFAAPTGALRHVVTVNAELFVLAHQRPAFSRLLSRTVNTVDGRVVQWLTGLAAGGRRWPRKLAGSDLIYDLASWCCQCGARLFLLGASEDANRIARARLAERYRGLQIDGFAPAHGRPLDDPAWNREILDAIARFRPTHLVVCFGPPRQEEWIAAQADALARLGVVVAFGLGGAADFVAGVQRRAPRAIQWLGLEWLFRLVHAPRARFRRTLRMLLLPYYALVSGTGRRRAQEGDAG
jgi:N-acetylglucosaminyldiphosphoundecaprenol N-acetyl-beta-D-mannosaminyltransferase